MDEIKWIYDVFEDLTASAACHCSVVVDGERWETDYYIEVVPML